MPSVQFLRWIAAALMIVATAPPVRAQWSPPPPSAPRVASSRGITLREPLTTALRQNPDLRIAAAVTDSARAEHRIAAAIPNPQLGGTPNTPYQYFASIPLDVTPQRFYRTRVAALGVSASVSDRLDVERQVT